MAEYKARKIKAGLSPEELTGQKFGVWTVIGDAGLSRSRRQLQCKCICGIERTVDSYSLRSGGTSSCGCQKARIHATAFNRELSGEWLAEYRIWRGMLTRTTNPKTKAYKYYGGRGIRVCLGYRDFRFFLSKVGKRPSKFWIERKNNDHGYSCGKCADCVERGEPDNVCWASPTQQGRNRGDTHWLTDDSGKRASASEWAEIFTVRKDFFYRAPKKKYWCADRLFAEAKGLRWADRLTTDEQ